MRNKLLIIGASGHGRVIADIALSMNRWVYIGFLDDNEEITSFMGLEVIGKSSDACKYLHDSDIFVGIGSNATRQKLLNALEAQGASIPTLIHPKAIIGSQVEIERGTAVMAGAVVNCCTRIGKGCIINTGATVDHDNLIEDYAHISPGVNLGGAVKVGRGTWLGIGSRVSNNIIITSDCKVGAGAVVVKEITEPGTYVGVPAGKI